MARLAAQLCAVRDYCDLTGDLSGQRSPVSDITGSGRSSPELEVQKLLKQVEEFLEDDDVAQGQGQISPGYTGQGHYHPAAVQTQQFSPADHTRVYSQPQGQASGFQGHRHSNSHAYPKLAIRGRGHVRIPGHIQPTGGIGSSQDDIQDLLNQVDRVLDDGRGQ